MPMIGNEPAWRAILRQCGYPTDVAVLDWETYFDSEYHMGRDSSALSTINYVMDERYEELGFSSVLVRQPFQPITPSFHRGGERAARYIEYLQSEYGKGLEGITVIAQNAPFDGTILTRKYGIVPPYFIDILGLARHEESRQDNDLGSMAERMNLPPKGETKEFKGLHLDSKWRREPGKPPVLVHRGMTDEQFGRLSDYANHDAWLEWEVFIRLLPRLSRPDVELRLIQHTLEMFFKPILSVDQDFATSLIAQMNGRVDELIAATGHTKKDISGTNSFSALLAAALDAAGDKVGRYQKQGKLGPLLAIAKDDPQLELLTKHGDDTVRKLMAARTSIKSWPLHIERVQRIADQAKAAGGLLPVPLRYCGAHTGRWAGGEKINLQNLPSRSPEKLVNSIRNLLVAPEGKKLVIVDASQIEARVDDWIAGEDVEVWKDASRDPYCEFAAKIAKKPLRKARKSDPPPLAAYYTRMRGMGKVGVLGCGYGMGADKAIAFADSSYGVTLSTAEALDIVQTYRKSHPNVCKFWRMIEQKFKAAARYHEPGTLNGLKFHYEPEGDITVITLPNGRTLKYPKVRVSIINGREQIWMPNPRKPGDRTMMWGGFLTENVVQAMSRDILAEGVLATEAAGHRVALHVHDEIVAVEDTDKAEKALATILQILSTPPAWAAGCPLAAEGKITERYEK